MSTPTWELLAQLADMLACVGGILADDAHAKRRMELVGNGVDVALGARRIAECARQPQPTETGSEAGVSAATCGASNAAQSAIDSAGQSSAAAPSPAPSSPRRWMMTEVLENDYVTRYVVAAPGTIVRVGPFERLGGSLSVVEASAYDAVVNKAEELRESRDSWRLLTVRAERERDAARAELANARRITPEVVERAAEAIAAKAGFAWTEKNLLIDTKQIRELARAALLAAGFQEVSDAT